MADPADRKSILSLKSWLFTPGTKANRFHRAAEAHANALIIDLEDRPRVKPAMQQLNTLPISTKTVFHVRFGSTRRMATLVLRICGRS
jgi:citrate lyase beta subunit